MFQLQQRRSRATLTCLAIVVSALSGCGDKRNPTAPTTPVAATPVTTTTTTVPAFSLAGSWERVDSSFTELNGMVVRVNDAETEGDITSVQSNIYRFAAGDLKWRRVVRRSPTQYEFEDLVRQAGSGRQSYVAGIIEVQSSQQELRLRFPTTGTFQIWRRR